MTDERDEQDVQDVRDEQRTLGQRLSRTTAYRSQGRSPFVERTAAQRLRALAALAGLQLSTLALLAELVNRGAPGTLPSVGLEGPLAGMLLFSVLLWRLRSRRRPKPAASTHGPEGD